MIENRTNRESPVCAEIIPFGQICHNGGGSAPVDFRQNAQEPVCPEIVDSNGFSQNAENAVSPEIVGSSGLSGNEENRISGQTVDSGDFGTNGEMRVCAKTVDPTAHFIRELRIQTIVSLAGKQGEKRALRGGAPGWRRHRTKDELIAFHEAAHAAVAHVLGHHVHKLSAVINEAVSVDTVGLLGGFCRDTSEAVPPPEAPLPAQVRGDIYRAAEVIKILALAEPEPYSWRLALRVARRLRARARDLVERCHYPLIIPLAEELVRQCELDHDAIARFLTPEMRGILDP